MKVMSLIKGKLQTTLLFLVKLSNYPLFRGLQRPLEFMGLHGRYIYWATGTVGGEGCAIHKQDILHRQMICCKQL